MKYLVGLLFFMTDIALACEAMTAAQLQERLKAEPAEQLVFFASWCSSCKEHLKADLLPKSYFIAAFDEQDSARQAFGKFLGDAHRKRCIWDQDGSIAEAFGVKSVPAIKRPDGK